MDKKNPPIAFVEALEAVKTLLERAGDYKGTDEVWYKILRVNFGSLELANTVGLLFNNIPAGDQLTVGPVVQHDQSCLVFLFRKAGFPDSVAEYLTSVVDSLIFDRQRDGVLVSRALPGFLHDRLAWVLGFLSKEVRQVEINHIDESRLCVRAGESNLAEEFVRSVLGGRVVEAE